CGMVANEIADGGFEATETEIIVRFIDHWPGKIVRAQIALFCETVDCRTCRIGEAEQFSPFVEAFTCGIVHSLAKNVMFQQGLDVHEHGMAAADNEGDIRLKL